jgi:hypothetical protein
MYAHPRVLPSRRRLPPSGTEDERMTMTATLTESVPLAEGFDVDDDVC